MFPNKIFYTYTKVHTLNTSYKPDNMILILSDDDMIHSQYWHKFDGVAVVRDRAPAPPGFTVCPGDCKACTYCYTKTGDREFKQIMFNKH